MDVNLFGSGSAVAAQGASQTKKAEGFSDNLTFQDGRRLRGELVALRADEVTWKRGDASAPFTFPRTEIRSISLAIEDAAAPLVLAGNEATVKLAGSDWLYAPVTSKDGDSFQISVRGGSQFIVPRSSIEWMVFAPSPVPVMDLTAGPLGLDGWAGVGGPDGIEMDGEWMTTKSHTQWLGREITPPKRFEVALDLDPNDQQVTTLWLQPFSVGPDYFARGTVELEFSLGSLIEKSQRETSKLEGAADVGGRSRIRVLYDGIDGKLLLYRNGVQVAARALQREKNDPAAKPIDLTGICIQRKSGLRVARFVVQPWDGSLPKTEAETKDVLSVGNQTPVAGRLESISDTELTFSGEKKPLTENMLLKFPAEPRALADGDAALRYGMNGELTVAKLAIADGRARFESSFAGALEVPTSALQEISFKVAPAKPVAADVLVFKNGDELLGTLAKAENGKPLLWRTTSGQELEIQPTWVAGVRFQPAEGSKQSEGSMVELRNGDRLRAELLSFNTKEVRLRNTQLGEFGISREQLWMLYPNPANVFFDGGGDPTSWMEPRPRGGWRIMRPETSIVPSVEVGKVYLDGFFVLRPPGIGRDMKGLGDKYELRFEATDISGNQEPNLDLEFSAEPVEGYASWLTVGTSKGSLRVQGRVTSKEERTRTFSKDVQLRQPMDPYKPDPRISVRVFVDKKAGTVDIYTDGVLRTKIGQVPKERIPQIGGFVAIDAYSESGWPVVLSNLWAGPWVGELPDPGIVPEVTLTNGDRGEGQLREFKQGVLGIEMLGTEIELPANRVKSFSFAGEPDTSVSAGRVRLRSGESISLKSFKLENGKLTSQTAALGSIELPADSIRELVFDPAAVRFPKLQDPRK